MLKILTNNWYSGHINPKTNDLDEYLKKNYSKWMYKLASKVSLIRGFLFFHAGRRFDVLITPLWGGVYSLLLFETLFSKKKNRIIILEFIREMPQNKSVRFVYPAWIRFFFIPALKRTMLSAQVLAEHEINDYSQKFDIPKSKFRFISWPLHYNKKREPDGDSSTAFDSVMKGCPEYVMVSGLGNVDWEAIFEAADKSDWPLLAVCSKGHLSRVNRLNKSNRAVVLNDISQYEHSLYVKQATVYALCLEELYVSVGHMRLMNTIENGVPVVATAVSGLRGYAFDGVNALLVPPGDVSALKQAIDRLMNDPDLRKSLVISAKQFGNTRTFERYLEEISTFVQDSIKKT